MSIVKTAATVSARLQAVHSCWRRMFQPSCTTLPTFSFKILSSSLLPVLTKVPALPEALTSAALGAGAVDEDAPPLPLPLAAAGGAEGAVIGRPSNLLAVPPKA